MIDIRMFTIIVLSPTEYLFYIPGRLFVPPFPYANGTEATTSPTVTTGQINFELIRTTLRNRVRRYKKRRLEFEKIQLNFSTEAGSLSSFAVEDGIIKIPSVFSFDQLYSSVTCVIIHNYAHRCPLGGNWE